MFIKLLKQEFKATRRLVPLIYLVTLFLILINLLVRQLGIAWLSTTMIILLGLFGVAEILMTYVVVFYRYYKNLYNSEGYLMHTLPVPPRQLLTSKIVMSFIWLLISYLIMLGVVLTIALLTAGEQGQSLGQFVELLIAATGLSTASIGWLAAALGGYLCLSLFFLMGMVFLAISLGNLSRFHQLGLAAPILFFLGIYLLMEIGILAGMILVPLGLTISGQAVQVVPRSTLATFLNPDDVIIGFGGILFILLATPAMFIATGRLIKKHTSLK